MAHRGIHVAVVGAGVGGVAAVGALAAAGARVTWLDPSFSAGAFAKYRDVPANTKVSLLAGHFEQLIPQGMGAARTALDQLRTSAYPLRLDADPDGGEGWCGLNSVADVLCAMTNDILLPRPEVHSIAGQVRRLRQITCADDLGSWQVDIDDNDGVCGAPLRADAVVLATGCTPSGIPHALRPEAWAGSPKAHELPLEEALQLDRLAGHLAVTGSGPVGVVGGGHSGIVVVRALLGLVPAPPPSVRLFVRRPIQLAQWDPTTEAYGAWGFRGLKGAAAELALEHELVGRAPPNGPSTPGGRLELWDVDALRTDGRCAGMACALPPAILARRPHPVPIPKPAGRRVE
jgi:cation diffusion facilitator CzcD-associated flavoprotein CzcO